MQWGWLRLITATVVAVGVLVSGAHLMSNGAGQTSAMAAAPEADEGTGVLDQALLTAIAAAKAAGAFEAIEGSLIYLGAQYETATTAEDRTRGAPEPASEWERGDPLPPASAGTNGTPVPPPPGGRDERLVARIPASSEAVANGTAATYVSGIALAPPNAPDRVAGAINAANTIVGRPYLWGGGHGSWYARGYDCSGAVSFALAGGGFLASPLASGQLESWGEPGPGRWITVYASSSHAYAVIAGLRWDTVGDARGTGPRWHVAGTPPAGFVARHPPGY
jgi:cell wall-associated NlpC family hydrolase